MAVSEKKILCKRTFLVTQLQLVLLHSNSKVEFKITWFSVFSHIPIWFFYEIFKVTYKYTLYSVSTKYSNKMHFHILIIITLISDHNDWIITRVSCYYTNNRI